MRGVIRKCLGVCAGLLLLAPASALAGTASVEDGIARYDGAFGEVNNVTVSEGSSIDLDGDGRPDRKAIVFHDSGAPVNGCDQIDPNRVACLVPIDSPRVRAGLGNKNDRIQPADPNMSLGFSVEGDLGDDVLIGTHRRDVLDGVGGNDTLRGRNGNDALEGANGNDDLRGDAGQDDMLGGADNDTLDADDNAPLPGDVVPFDDADCGTGFDFVRYNAGDLITSCEQQLKD
jgi:Ca2+-binding RTX toxin-like protein